MPIKINGSTSGSTTITAPATGTDETIELSTALAAKLGIAGGKVINIVSSTYSTEASTTSSTYGATGISATITPSLSTSKVLVIVSNPVACNTNGSGGRVGLRLVRGTTTILTNDRAVYGDFSVTTGVGALVTQWHMDSPATTSATTYYQHFANMLGGIAGGTTAYSCFVNQPASMYLIEVSA